MNRLALRIFTFMELCVLIATAWFVVNSFVPKELSADVNSLITPGFRNKSFLTYVISMESTSPEFFDIINKMAAQDPSIVEGIGRPDIKNFFLQILIRSANTQFSTLYEKCLMDRNYDTRVLGFIGLSNTNESVGYSPSIEYFLENSHDDFLLQILLSYYSKVPWKGRLGSITKHQTDKNPVVSSLAKAAASRARGLS